MAYTPGDFSASVLGDILVKEAEILESSRQSETKLSIVAGQAVLSHQDPRLTTILEGNGVGQKCVGAKVIALRSCDFTVVDTPSWECTAPASQKAGTESLTLDKSIISKINFTVDDNLCRNAYTFEEVLAEVKLRAKIKLEVDLTRKIVAMLSANADTPVTSWFETPGTVNGNTFEIDAVNFKSDIYADFMAAAGITYMSDPIIINGRNLFNDTFLAQFKGAACCDNDQVLTGMPFQYYFDLHNIDGPLNGKYSFIVDKNALIFWSAQEFTNMEPILWAQDTYHWSETLPRLQYFANGVLNPIYVDIKATRVCVSGNTYGWNISMYLNGALSVNLANCDNRKGIIKVLNKPPTP